MAAADSLDPDFPDGVWSIALASLNTHRLVIPTIAAAFGISEQAGRSTLDQLTDRIGDRRLLLLLDNFEHVIEAASEVAVLSAGCRNLSILVTSRAPLRIYGEREFPVLPLSLPVDVRVTAAEQLSRFAAIALFIDRVKAVLPGFEFTSEVADDVASICRRLDGLPLAIELAAARSRLFSPRELLGRLDHPLAILEGGPRDVPLRQQTVRNTVAWSYDLLSSDQQRMLRHLSSFRGGWTLEAAHEVADPDAAVENLLEALIEQNLVQVRETDGGRRFGTLETIREFAYAQLEVRGESEQVLGRHADYFNRFADGANILTDRDPLERQAWDLLQAEMDNLRAVFERAIASKNAQLALSLTTALRRFWLYSGRYVEAEYWLESALRLDSPAPAAVRARAYLLHGHIVRQLGDLQLATQSASKATKLFDDAGDLDGMVEALVLAGWTNNYSGDYVRAKDLAEQAVRGARASGDKHITASALDTLCVATCGHLDFAGADLLCSESLALYREVGDLQNVCRVLGFLGYNALLQTQLDRSNALLTEALLLADRTGNIDQYAFIVGLFGWVDLERGAYDHAYFRFAEALSHLDAMGAVIPILWSLEGMASAAAGLNDPLHAAQLLGATEAIRKQVQTSLQPWRRARYERDRSAIQCDLGIERFETAMRQGSLLSLAQATRQALGWLDTRATTQPNT